MNIKIASTLLYTLLILIGSMNSLQAQSTEEASLSYYKQLELAYESIGELKEGALVVVLRSYNRKIKEMNRLLKSSSVSGTDKARLQQQLRETIAERDADNREFLQAFQNNYDFSKCFVMYDTAAAQLKSGVTAGYLLDNNLKPDPSISLEELSIYVVRVGSLDASTTSGFEALIVADNNFDNLEKPFPYFVRLRGIGSLINKIFDSKKSHRKQATDLVIKLNEAFWKFYEE
ncbi:MAG: hypothetical protein AAGG75_02775 [Bacteroidota bacterium]